MAGEKVLTVSGMLWRAMGMPAPKWELEPVQGLCGTCGQPITAGVPQKAINSPTFAQHADYLKYGTHVCAACAYLYGMGRSRPGNFLVVGERVYWPVISQDAETEERPSWLRVIREVARMDPRLPAAGVLTTDVKPRLWPRARAVTLRAFGLYVHAPEYDVSEFRELDLFELERVALEIVEALRLGFTKADVYHGLWRNYKRMKKHGKAGVELEKTLAGLRQKAEFVPALVIAGVRKGEKDGAAGGTERDGKARGEADQVGLGLL